MSLDTSAVVSLLGAVASVGSAGWIHARQLRLQLFEKRVAIYDTTCSFLAHVGQEGKPHEMDQIYTFLRDTRNAQFLFRPKISKLLNEIREKAIEYRTRHKVWEAKPAGPDRQALYEEVKACENALHGFWDP